MKNLQLFKENRGLRSRSRRPRRLLVLAATLAAAIGGTATPTTAAGLLVADGGFGGVLEQTQHEVDVTINNGIVVTSVAQVFRNTENRIVEALYTFPVPKGASVSNFSMWIGGKEMVGEVLEKERAREIYESYKQTRKDPGLLEQVDYKTFEMRIFPIAAGAEQRVQVTYYQELDFAHDWTTYVYPLATVSRDGVDANVSGRFALNLRARSEIPITTLESPSHTGEFAIVNHAPGFWEASLETEGGNLERDFVLSLRQERKVSGVDLITSKVPGDDGYFLLALTAGEAASKLDTGADYIFVLDVSGSMGQDRKLILSRRAIEAFIQSLGDKDTFDVMAFNVAPVTLFNSLHDANQTGFRRASEFLATQEARGGTNLTPALRTAFKYGDPDRPLNIVILSDGMTEQRSQQELLALSNEKPANARVFCVGVGNETNRRLLEQLAHRSGGLAAFLSSEDDFDRQANAFRQALTQPIAHDLSLTVDGVQTYDVEPREMPDLYAGTPVRIYGRYKDGGTATVTLSGTIRGREYKTSAKLDFPQVAKDNPEIERMWASKRVDRLLKQIDLGGKKTEWVDEIVRLGELYSIATEYTSFLVLENNAEYERWNIERRNTLREARDREARERVRSNLDNLREQALNALGPREAKQDPTQLADTTTNTHPATPTAPQRVDRAQERRGFDLPNIGGTGPVGPLFVLLTGAAAWVRRRFGQNDNGDNE